MRTAVGADGSEKTMWKSEFQKEAERIQRRKLESWTDAPGGNLLAWENLAALTLVGIGETLTTYLDAVLTRIEGLTTALERQSGLRSELPGSGQEDSTGKPPSPAEAVLETLTTGTESRSVMVSWRWLRGVAETLSRYPGDGDARGLVEQLGQYLKNEPR